MIDMENRIVGVVTINTKWQLIIPVEARKILNLKPWDSMICMTKWDKLIWFVKAEDIKSFVSTIYSHIDKSTQTVKNKLDTLIQFVEDNNL